MKRSHCSTSSTPLVRRNTGELYSTADSPCRSLFTEPCASNTCALVKASSSFTLSPPATLSRKLALSINRFFVWRTKIRSLLSSWLTSAILSMSDKLEWMASRDWFLNVLVPNNEQRAVTLRNTLAASSSKHRLSSASTLTRHSATSSAR